MKKNPDFEGTFFEEVLEHPEVPIESSIIKSDREIGKATNFELLCFYFYLTNTNPEKYGKKFDSSEGIRRNVRAHTVMGFMRSLIADRFNVSNEEINRIWLRSGGVIVLMESAIM